MLFTGRGKPPKYVADGAAVRKLVAEDPALVGYIEKTELDSTVRLVLAVP